MKRKKWLNSISLLTVLSFILPYVSWAFEGSTFSMTVASIHSGVFFAGKPITIPRQLGSIRQGYQGSGKTVICIQDLHCNLEVQKNIAGIIQHLKNNLNLNFVAEEGAFGTLDLSVLRNFPLFSIRADVSDYFIKQGKLTGAEYYAATSNQAIRLEGVETPEFYNSSLRAVRTFLNSEAQGCIVDLREILYEIKPAVYSPTLQRYDQTCRAYRDGKLDLLGYAKYLVTQAQSYQVTVELYPVLKQFLNQQQSVINPEALHQETEALDTAIRQILYSTEDQRELDQLCRQLDLLERVLNISATPEEVRMLRDHRAEYAMGYFAKFISAHDPENAYAINQDYQTLDEYLKQAEEFYRLATIRSTQFVENLIRKMDENHEAVAVMINGGFHTDEITTELKRRGVSFVSVLPSMTRQDIVNPYFSLLQGKQLPLEKLLEKNQSIMAVRAWPETPSFSSVVELIEKTVALAEQSQLSVKIKNELQAFFEKHTIVDLQPLTQQELAQVTYRVPVGSYVFFAHVQGKLEPLPIVIANKALFGKPAENLIHRNENSWQTIGGWGMAVCRTRSELQPLLDSMETHQARRRIERYVLNSVLAGVTDVFSQPLQETLYFIPGFSRWLNRALQMKGLANPAPITAFWTISFKVLLGAGLVFGIASGTLAIFHLAPQLIWTLGVTVPLLSQWAKVSGFVFSGVHKGKTPAEQKSLRVLGSVLSLVLFIPAILVLAGMPFSLPLIGPANNVFQALVIGMGFQFVLHVFNNSLAKIFASGFFKRIAPGWADRLAKRFTLAAVRNGTPRGDKEQAYLFILLYLSALADSRYDLKYGTRPNAERLLQFHENAVTRNDLRDLIFETNGKQDPDESFFQDKLVRKVDAAKIRYELLIDDETVLAIIDPGKELILIKYQPQSKDADKKSIVVDAADISRDPIMYSLRAAVQQKELAAIFREIETKLDVISQHGNQMPLNMSRILYTCPGELDQLRQNQSKQSDAFLTIMKARQLLATVDSLWALVDDKNGNARQTALEDLTRIESALKLYVGQEYNQIVNSVPMEEQASWKSRMSEQLAWVAEMRQRIKQAVTAEELKALPEELKNAAARVQQFRMELRTASRSTAPTALADEKDMPKQVVLDSVRQLSGEVAKPVNENGSLQGKVGKELLEYLAVSVLTMLEWNYSPGKAVMEIFWYSTKKVTVFLKALWYASRVAPLGLPEADSFRALPVLPVLKAFYQTLQKNGDADARVLLALRGLISKPNSVQILLPMAFAEKSELAEMDEDMVDEDMARLGVFNLNGVVYMTRTAFDRLSELEIIAVCLHERLEINGLQHAVAANLVEKNTGFSNSSLIAAAGLGRAELPSTPTITIPIQLLSKADALNQIARFIQAVKGGKYQTGSVVDLRTLPKHKEIILVGDLHTKLKNLKKILNTDNTLAKLRRGDAVLLILGDAVHPEALQQLQEMDSSVEIMQFIMELKIQCKDSVYYLLGNHDYFSENVKKGVVKQGVLFKDKMLAYYGKQYLDAYQAFIQASPMLAVGEGLVASHAGPVKRDTTLEAIRGMHALDEDHPVRKDLQWSRFVRNDYSQSDVQRFLRNLGQNNAFFVVGHSPGETSDWHWQLFPRHHVVFAGDSTVVGFARYVNGELAFVEATKTLGGLRLAAPTAIQPGALLGAGGQVLLKRIIRMEKVLEAFTSYEFNPAIGKFDGINQQAWRNQLTQLQAAVPIIKNLMRSAVALKAETDRMVKISEVQRQLTELEAVFKTIRTAFLVSVAQQEAGPAGSLLGKPGQVILERITANVLTILKWGFATSQALAEVAKFSGESLTTFLAVLWEQQQVNPVALAEADRNRGTPLLPELRAFLTTYQAGTQADLGIITALQKMVANLDKVLILTPQDFQKKVKQVKADDDLAKLGVFHFNSTIYMMQPVFNCLNNQQLIAVLLHEALETEGVVHSEAERLVKMATGFANQRLIAAAGLQQGFQQPGALSLGEDESKPVLDELPKKAENLEIANKMALLSLVSKLESVYAKMERPDLYKQFYDNTLVQSGNLDLIREMNHGKINADLFRGFMVSKEDQGKIWHELQLDDEHVLSVVLRGHDMVLVLINPTSPKSGKKNLVFSAEDIQGNELLLALKTAVQQQEMDAEMHGVEEKLGVIKAGKHMEHFYMLTSADSELTKIKENMRRLDIFQNLLNLRKLYAMVMETYYTIPQAERLELILRPWQGRMDGLENALKAFTTYEYNPAIGKFDRVKQQAWRNQLTQLLAAVPVIKNLLRSAGTVNDENDRMVKSREVRRQLIELEAMFEKFQAAFQVSVAEQAAGPAGSLLGSRGQEILERMTANVLTILKLGFTPGQALAEVAKFSGKQLTTFLATLGEQQRVKPITLAEADRLRGSSIFVTINTFLRDYQIQPDVDQRVVTALAAIASSSQAIEILSPATFREYAITIQTDTDLLRLGVFNLRGKIFMTQSVYEALDNQALLAVLLHEALEINGLSHGGAEQLVQLVTGYTNQGLISAAGLGSARSELNETRTLKELVQTEDVNQPLFKQNCIGEQVYRHRNNLFGPRFDLLNNIRIRLGGAFRVGYEELQPGLPVTERELRKEEVVFVITIPRFLRRVLISGSEKTGWQKISHALQARLVSFVLNNRLADYISETKRLAAMPTDSEQAMLTEYSGESMLRVDGEQWTRLAGTRSATEFYQPSGGRRIGVLGSEIGKLLESYREQIMPEIPGLWPMLEQTVQALLREGQVPSPTTLVQALLKLDLQTVSDPTLKCSLVLLQNSIRAAEQAAKQTHQASRLTAEINHVTELIIRSRQGKLAVGLQLQERFQPSTVTGELDQARLILDAASRESMRTMALGLYQAAPKASVIRENIEFLLELAGKEVMTPLESSRLQFLLKAVCLPFGQRVAMNVGEDEAKFVGTMLNGRIDTLGYNEGNVRWELSEPVVAQVFGDTAQSIHQLNNVGIVLEHLTLIPYHGQLPIPQMPAGNFQRDIVKILEKNPSFSKTLSSEMALAQAYFRWVKQKNPINNQQIARVIIRIMKYQARQLEHQPNQQVAFDQAMDSVNNLFQNSKIFRSIRIGQNHTRAIYLPETVSQGGQLGYFWLLQHASGDFLMKESLESELRKNRLRNFRVNSAA